MVTLTTIQFASMPTNDTHLHTARHCGTIEHYTQFLKNANAVKVQRIAVILQTLKSGHHKSLGHEKEEQYNTFDCYFAMICCNLSLRAIKKRDVYR